MNRMGEIYIRIDGGIEERYANIHKNPGNLIYGTNVEVKTEGGLRKILGFTKFDSAEVPGEGALLGGWKYGGTVYAFRNAVGGATAAMYSSTGSGWTLKKSGLTPNGSYEFENYDFQGTQNMYGVSGVHKAFEWDGTTWTDITTGMTTDTPDHLIGFKKHLFLSFDRSVQYSPIGDPTGTWSVVTGANEMALADIVTGFMRMSGGVLGIFSRNSTNILNGSSSADFINANLSEHGLQIGAIAGTLQQMGSRVYYLDDRGVVDFYTTQAFGDFSDSTISQAIQDQLASNSAVVTTSCVVKTKSQYRIFFEDGSGYIFAFNGTKLKGITRLLFVDSNDDPVVVRHVWNTEDSNGQEQIFFTSDDGYVRLMDSGNSFDGVDIFSTFQLVFFNLNIIGQEKRFRKVVLDLAGTIGANTLYVKPEFKFNRPTVSEYTSISATTGGFILGSSILGTDKLGGTRISEGKAFIPGAGEYVSLIVYSDDSAAPWELNGISYKYLMGRRLR